jgi:hypothetical protein
VHVRWFTIHTFGVPYQEVYLDVNGTEVGSITRFHGSTRYNAFFSNGKIKRSTTRGTFVTARDWVDGQFKHNPL